MFWQGGFTFYSAVVVHVGHEVLSRRVQGFVTRRVTDYLNIAGIVALPLLAWDAASSRRAHPTTPQRGRRRRALRWLCWVVLADTLAVQFWLHGRLDAMLDPTAFAILDGGFYGLHRWYLNVSTIQWCFALAYGLLALLSWRDEDRRLPCPS